MKKVKLIKTDEYSVNYIVLESNCPMCGAPIEERLEDDGFFLKKEIKCYECNVELDITYNYDK